jgi:hypothetical protein
MHLHSDPFTPIEHVLFLHWFNVPVSDIRQNVPCSVTDDKLLAISLFTMKYILSGATACALPRVELRTMQCSSHISRLLFLVRRHETEVKLCGLSPRERGRYLSAKLMSNLRIEGCRVVSATHPRGRNLRFLDRSRYFFFQVVPQLYSGG